MLLEHTFTQEGYSDPIKDAAGVAASRQVLDWMTVQGREFGGSVSVASFTYRTSHTMLLVDMKFSLNLQAKPPDL